MPVLSNSKHERFAQGLAQGRSADEAYALAGYTPHRSNAARLSANDSVRSRVEEILSKAADKAGVTVERVLAELAKIGFSDIRRAVQWTGSETADEVDGEDDGVPRIVVRAANIVRLISSEAIDDDTAASISEITQTKEGALKVKLHDKLSALDKLGRHLGMFKDKVEHSGPGGAPIKTESRLDLSDLDTEERDALRAIIERRARRSDDGASGA